MASLIGLGFISGFFISISLGFVFFLLIEAGIQRGWRSALPLIAGVLIGDSLLVLSSLWYSQQMAEFLASWENEFRWVAGLTFFTLGLWQWFRKPTNLESMQNNGQRYFWQALGINLSNPSNWAFWLLLFSAPPVSVASLEGQMAFGISALLSIGLSEWAVAFLASLMGQRLPQKAVDALNRALSLGLMLLGLYWLLVGF
ncbi:MAG: LysE family translocator [Bacteroidia bacterium]